MTVPLLDTLTKKLHKTCKSLWTRKSEHLPRIYIKMQKQRKKEKRNIEKQKEKKRGYTQHACPERPKGHTCGTVQFPGFLYNLWDQGEQYEAAANSQTLNVTPDRAPEAEVEAGGDKRESSRGGRREADGGDWARKPWTLSMQGEKRCIKNEAFPGAGSQGRWRRAAPCDTW